MTIKIFFDMDGVLVDFAGGAVVALNDAITSYDMSSKQMRRLINYDGEDREPITVDFLEAIVQKKDMKLPRTQWEKRVTNAVFKIVGQGGHPYWSTLPSNPGYLQMVDAADNLVGLANVYVCTAPIQDPTGGCESGKRAWIDSHTLISAENVFVTEDKGSIAAKFPNDVCILIDDRLKYCQAWEASGGIAIQHAPPATISRVQQTIKQLELIVNSHIL
tara:strand:+ start:3014 stop:3667 length:654 start_codon:yes stop_codon:yes gene_type:complete